MSPAKRGFAVGCGSIRMATTRSMHGRSAHGASDALPDPASREYLRDSPHDGVPQMPLAELLLPEFDEEMTATRRVLERVPDGKAAWKPHPKSMTLGRLATLVAELPAWVVNTLTKDELDIMPPGGPPPKFEALGSTKQMLELFDRNAKAARAALARTPDAEFERPWTFKV